MCNVFESFTIFEIYKQTRMQQKLEFVLKSIIKYMYFLGLNSDNGAIYEITLYKKKK